MTAFNTPVQRVVEKPDLNPNCRSLVVNKRARNWQMEEGASMMWSDVKVSPSDLPRSRLPMVTLITLAKMDVWSSSSLEMPESRADKSQSRHVSEGCNMAIYTSYTSLYSIICYFDWWKLYTSRCRFMYNLVCIFCMRYCIVEYILHTCTLYATTV